MIAPSFATMLCFIETDASFDAQTLGRMTSAASEHSFERISVDGQLSTNDSIFMIASGAAGLAVDPGSDDEQLFARALDALLRQLALEVVADGEGATRVARLVVRGISGSTAPVARAVANSPLVRCALYGGDPNWGRIVQAGGQALLDVGSVAFDVAIEEVEVARNGIALELDDARRDRLKAAMRAPEVELTLSFGDGDEESEIFFCDLGPEYVRVNSEYS
jgi:glutamate N-acetyltransferase / amino-acid N-acetyltransferase